MNKNRKKILFISQDASRTGAPLVLYEVLQKLKKAEKFYIKVLFLQGGDLLNDFKLLCDVEVIAKTNNTFFSKIKRKFFNENQLVRKLNDENFDLLYVNTIASFAFFTDIHLLNMSKTILHLHESKNFTTYTSFDMLKKAVEKSDKIICVSNFVKEHLLSLVEIEAEKLCVFYPAQKVSDNISNEYFDLEIPEDAFVVGGCGNYNVIKGLDLFLMVAKNVIEQEKEKPIYFIWLGDSGRKEMKYIIDNDIEKLGLKNRVRILSKTKNPKTIFSKFDLFFLSAREEAFGLAAFENGLLGKPIVYFKGASGISELLDNHSGVSIDYLNIDQATNSILDLYRNNDVILCKADAVKKSFNTVLLDNSKSKLEDIIFQLMD